jgi:hypothetical protein
MNIILYKKVPSDGESKSDIIHYYSADGIITEQYPDGKTFSWKRLPSDLWIQMHRDWVPGQVVRRLEGQQPLKFVHTPAQQGCKRYSQQSCEAVHTPASLGGKQTQPFETYKRITKQQDGESKEQTFSRKSQYHGQKPLRHGLFQQCLIRLP